MNELLETSGDPVPEKRLTKTGNSSSQQPVVVNVYNQFDTTSILEKLDTIINNQNQIMATLADLQAEVTAEDSVVDSAIALLNGLAAQVAALQPNQDAIDALAADITAKTNDLAAAVTANTKG